MIEMFKIIGDIKEKNSELQCSHIHQCFRSGSSNRRDIIEEEYIMEKEKEHITTVFSKVINFFKGHCGCALFIYPLTFSTYLPLNRNGFEPIQTNYV